MRKHLLNNCLEKGDFDPFAANLLLTYHSDDFNNQFVSEGPLLNSNQSPFPYFHSIG